MNGVYGTVAEFEIKNHTAGVTSLKRVEKYQKPSRGHTRASTMAHEQIFRNTLSNGLKLQES